MLLLQNTNLELILPNKLTDNSNNRYQDYLRQAQIIYSQLLSNHPKFEPRPYQPEMAALYALRANNICAGSCGVGKTLIVGLLISIIYKEWTKPGQIHIAVPSILSAKSRWLVDLEKIECLKNKIEVINSEKDLLNSTKPIFIYTLDFIKRKSKTYKTIGKLISRKKRPSLLVIDEIHLLKPNSQRSDEWLKLKRYCKRFLALSGTLSDGRLDLIHHVLKFTYNNHFHYTLKDFKENFGGRTKVKSNYLRGEEEVEEVNPRYLGHLCATKVADFAAISHRFIHRVSLNDPAIRSVVTVPSYDNHLVEILPSKAHRESYITLVLESQQKLIKLKDTVNTKLAFKYLHPLMLASAWTDNVNNKLNKLISLVQNNKGKTVIFANLIETSRKLYNELNLLYPNQVVRLYATDEEATPKTLSLDKREELLSEFLFNNDIKVGVFSINLAAESIDLNVANQVIFYDYPWQALKIQQAIHRAVRPGALVGHVNVYYLVNYGMIDQHQYTLINQKNIGSRLILDFNAEDLNPSDYSSMNVTELIEKTMKVDAIESFASYLREEEPF
jgi:ERCC4-related helicase